MSELTIYYVLTDSSGNLAFYNSDVHTVIPTGVVEITETQWQNSLANPGKYSIVSGVFTAAAVWPSVLTAAQLKAQANAPILAKIAVLEASQTPRLYREATLNSSNISTTTSRTAAQELAYIDSQIVTLRTQLQK